MGEECEGKESGPFQAEKRRKEGRRETD